MPGARGKKNINMLFVTFVWKIHTAHHQCEICAVATEMLGNTGLRNSSATVIVMMNGLRHLKLELKPMF